MAGNMLLPLTLTWDVNSYDTPHLSGLVNLVCGRYPLFNSSATRATLPYGRGQWSNGRIPLPAALIPAAANRKADGTEVAGAVEAAAEVVQGAEPGTGRRRDG